jgi:hypothetical protein
VTKLGPCRFERLLVGPYSSSPMFLQWKEMYERLGDLGQAEENLEDLKAAFEGAWTITEMRQRLKGPRATMCKQQLSGDYKYLRY